jgi:hypothetical protein
MGKEMVFMESPAGDEIKEVEATPEALTPLMAHGWHQVSPPAPVGHRPVAPVQEE